MPQPAMAKLLAMVYYEPDFYCNQAECKVVAIPQGLIILHTVEEQQDTGHHHTQGYSLAISGFQLDRGVNHQDNDKTKDHHHVIDRRYI